MYLDEFVDVNPNLDAIPRPSLWPRSLALLNADGPSLTDPCLFKPQHDRVLLPRQWAIK